MPSTVKGLPDRPTGLSRTARTLSMAATSAPGGSTSSALRVWSERSAVGASSALSHPARARPAAARGRRKERIGGGVACLVLRGQEPRTRNTKPMMSEVLAAEEGEGGGVEGEPEGERGQQRDRRREGLARGELRDDPHAHAGELRDDGVEALDELPPRRLHLEREVGDGEDERGEEEGQRSDEAERRALRPHAHERDDAVDDGEHGEDDADGEEEAGVPDPRLQRHHEPDGAEEVDEQREHHRAHAEEPPAEDLRAAERLREQEVH